MNLRNNQKGFTIVELLIVIVVIAILAAISIVAYNGIQNRGKASASQALANQIAKKAEAYNTIESKYPSGTEFRANTGAGTTGNPAEAKLDDTSAVIDYASGTYNTAATYISGTKNIAVYRLLNATGSSAGGCVYWWDYSASTAVQKPIYFGTVSTGC